MEDVVVISDLITVKSMDGALRSALLATSILSENCDELLLYTVNAALMYK